MGSDETGEMGSEEETAYYQIEVFTELKKASETWEFLTASWV